MASAAEDAEPLECPLAVVQVPRHLRAFLLEVLSTCDELSHLADQSRALP
jgi:hypothetical protein